MRMVVMMVMMSVMQNTMVVFLQMWFLGVLVMEFLWFWFLLINRCYYVRDFKIHKKGTIFVLFGFAVFILVQKNFLSTKVKE